MTKPPRRWSWVPVLLVLGAVLVLLGLGVSYLSREALSTEIPALPDFGRYPAVVAEQITAADSVARAQPRSGSALGMLAMVYQANTFHEHAHIVYQLASRVEPDNPRWPYYVAILAITNGENERAQAFLSRAIESYPDYPHAWARQGEIAFRRGVLDEARQAFQRALQLEPNHPHAILGVARLAGRRDDWGEVVRLLEPAVARDANFGPAHGYLAIAYEHLGQPEQARRHEGRGRDFGFQMSDPLLHELYELSSTGSVLVTQSKIAEDLGDAVRAERLLRRAVEVAPADKDVRLAISRFLRARGAKNRAYLEEAKQHLRTGLELDPTYAHTRYELGTVLFLLGDVSGAAAQWEQVIAEEPEYAMALMSLGHVCYTREDFQRAVEYCRRGLAVPRDTPFALGEGELGRAYYRLAKASQAAGAYAEALEAFSAALAHDPQLIDGYTDRAALLKELGRLDEAIACYRQGIARVPGDPHLRARFGNFLLKEKMFAEAHEQLRAALVITPRNPPVLAALGFVELQLQNVDEAVSRLREALALSPNYALAHYHLGNALLARGERDLAIRHYEAALRIQPGFQLAHEALAEANRE